MSARRGVVSKASALLAAVLLYGCATGTSVTEQVDGDIDAPLVGELDGQADGTHRHGDGGAEAGTHDAHKDTGGHHDVGVDAPSGDASGDASDDATPDAEPDTGTTCVGNDVICGSGCVNLKNDPKNCGACGNTCKTGLVCSLGTCAVSCASPEVLCNGPGEAGAKEGGAKEAGSHEAGSHDASSHAEAAAHDATSDTSSDAPKTDAEAQEAGDAVAAEAGTDAAVNPTGEYCADPKNDVDNCGGCGDVCPHGKHSSPVCGAGKCSITCDPGFTDCDGNPANGCEVQTSADPAACGTCTNVCSYTNGAAVCTSGVCGLGVCTPGFANCDHNAANGCETVTSNNVLDCGACGNACQAANATSSCVNGACFIATCNPGFQDCDGNAANGCETQTSTNVQHCGSCGTECQEENATAVCTAGNCAVGTCNVGFLDCDGQANDGCEVNSKTDPFNCGGCNNACTIANDVPACSGGTCVVAACSGQYLDCDAFPGNGCEVDSGTDPNNCGGCGHKCSEANGTASCVGGECAVAACDPGYADCNANPADGCETNTAGDKNNCGVCGNACPNEHGNASCTNSVCGISCSAGYANCDNDDANGCETNTATDSNNCGTCGTVCETKCGGTADHVGSAECASSSCVITSCTASYTDLDGTCSDGCECGPPSVASTCGAPTAITLTSAAPTTQSSTLTSGGVGWYEVSFNGVSNASQAYHPHVQFTNNPGNEYQFDVDTNCGGGTLSCGTEGGTSTGLTSWEVQGSAYQSYDTSSPGFAPVPNVGTVFIRVFRKAGAAVDCKPYTIQFSD